MQSWDTANKETDFSDYSVCTTWGCTAQRLYLLDVFRKRLSYPDLKRAVKAKAAEHQPSNILIEDRASGTQLIQDLIHEGCRAVTCYTPDNDKATRFYTGSNLIENGLVYVPTEAPWLDEYLREVALFPKGKYDDQVDSTSQMLSWTKRQQTALPLCDYYLKEHLERGGVVEDWMVDLPEPDPTPTCPRCGYVLEPEYGACYECAKCGHTWARPSRAELIRMYLKERGF